MDTVEKLIATEQKRDRNKSMDLAFGITNDSGSKEMILVELRLNYKNPHNLKSIELKEKVNSSCLVLSNIPPIHHEFIFILPTNIKQQARNWFHRMNPKPPSSYIVMDISDLHTKYFL